MHQLSNPRVTVCITAYNQGHYLAEAIESVLDQSYREFEVFLVDDASTDNTPSVANNYTRYLTVIRNEQNLGMVGNWNRVLTLGIAPYIAILHGDDLYLPAMLARTTHLLDTHPGIGYVYCAYYQIGPNGVPLGLVQPFLYDHVWAGAQEFRQHIRKNYVQCPTVVVRRECYERLGNFNPRFIYAADWEMWLRIETHGYEVGYISEPLACWRLHPSSTTRNLERQGISLLEDEIAVLNSVFDALPPGNESLCHLKRIAFYELTKKRLLQALLQARAGDWTVARASLYEALTAYQEGADIGIVPYFFLDGLRFAWRKRRRNDDGTARRSKTDRG